MKKHKPDAYREALNEVLRRVQNSLRDSHQGTLPIRMYIAGGAAVHIHTGARVTEDVDATFSEKVLLGDDIQISYRDVDGRARLLYLDRSYNDTLGLLHENAYADSETVEVPGIDATLLDVRVLSPLDLAVSKLARFADQDRDDIVLLAKKRLIDARALRKRAKQALGAYVGRLEPVHNSMEVACRLVDNAQKDN